MLNTTTNNLKSGAESFADSNVAEGVKTQMTKEEIEKAEKALQRQRSFSRLGDQAVQTSFGWMQQARDCAWANPKRHASCIFYDFTRGAVGTQNGPLWMEGRGKWLHPRLQR